MLYFANNHDGCSSCCGNGTRTLAKNPSTDSIQVYSPRASECIMLCGVVVQYIKSSYR
jgi:hypothetical protein